VNEIELNVFTCCDDNYIDFIPLFVVSNLYHIKNCFVEVGVKTENEHVIESTRCFLDKIYPNNFLIRKLDQQINCNGGTLRFINQPSVYSKYVYISDIDIVTLESNVVDTHLGIMKKHSLPYSNMIRDNSHRLTGLHFTPYENYYPIESYEDLNGLLQHDEVFLYHLIHKRFPNINNKNKIRPVHGIHMSPNRNASDKKLGWGLDSPKRCEQWTDFVSSEVFKLLYSDLSDRIKTNIEIINTHYGVTL